MYRSIIIYTPVHTLLLFLGTGVNMSPPTPPVTPTHTQVQIATDDKFKVILNDQENLEYREQQHIAKGELPYGKTLYARVRHVTEECGYSKWSPKVSFHVEIPAVIVGVAIDTSKSPAVVKYIDVNGNKLDKFNVATHPVFAAIAMAEMDDRAPATLTKFPKFYVKTASSGPAGSFAEGKTCYWISDLEFEGFRPHPAFKRVSGKVNDYVYIGTYVANSESVNGTSTIGSKQGSTVATGSASYTRDNLRTLATNRNNVDAGQSGWHMWDIWDLSLVQLLSLIWKCSMDTQTAYGTNTTTSPVAGATSSKIVFRGTPEAPEVWIDDLWSTYWQHVDGITRNGQVVSLTSPTGSAVTIGGDVSGYTLSSTTGYVKEFCSAPMDIEGDTHDILELFLPKTVVSSVSDATAPDYFYHASDTNYFKVGGYWGISDQGGLYALTCENEVYQESYTVQEITGYENNQWPSNRRCGYRIHSHADRGSRNNWCAYYAGTSGGERWEWYDYERRCDCPRKFGPWGHWGINGSAYSSCCVQGIFPQESDFVSWQKRTSCPKGWGRPTKWYSSDSESVQSGQGYVKNGRAPIYSTVTKYRDAWRNYFSTRVAKY